MALTTNNDKQSVMSWCQVWEPAIPMVSTSFATTAQKQQLIWEMSTPEWGAPPVVTEKVFMTPMGVMGPQTQGP